MRLGKLGNDRPEPSEPLRLLQELPDVYFFVDVSLGSEQHQPLFAPRRQVCAMSVAGELPGSREETPEQGNPIDVGSRKLIPQPRVPKPQVPQFMPNDESQRLLVLLVGVAEELAVDPHEVV